MELEQLASSVLPGVFRVHRVGRVCRVDRVYSVYGVYRVYRECQLLGTFLRQIFLAPGAKDSKQFWDSRDAMGQEPQVWREDADNRGVPPRFKT